MAKKKVDDRQAQREKARSRAAALGRSGWYKLGEGDNMFRILPTPESKTTQGGWLEYNLHRNIGPNKKAVTCGKDIDGNGKCWLCDKEIPRLQEKGSSRAAALAAKQQFVVQVAKVTGEEDDYKYSGPFLYSPSSKVAASILSSIFGSKKRDYTDPEKGYNISLSRSGTGFKDTRYGVLEIDEEPSEVPGTIIEKIKPFSELKEIVPYDEGKMKAAYQGVDASDDDDEADDEEEDDSPKKKKKAAADKASKSKADDDDEEDDDAEEDDDEEEPPAKSKAKGSKKKPADDDDDEEEDDEEDDDDEEDPPAKSKAKAKKKPADEDDDEEDADDEDDDDDEEEAPKKKGGGLKSKAGKKKPADDDAEDEEDAEDDDEEEPPTKGKKKPAKSKADDDDEEDDDAEEDDDEEEPPAKSKAKAGKKK